MKQKSTPFMGWLFNNSLVKILAKELGNWNDIDQKVLAKLEKTIQKMKIEEIEIDSSINDKE